MALSIQSGPVLAVSPGFSVEPDLTMIGQASLQKDESGMQKRVTLIDCE